jgi:hypothetical protein
MKQETAGCPGEPARTLRRSLSRDRTSLRRGPGEAPPSESRPEHRSWATAPNASGGVRGARDGPIGTSTASGIHPGVRSMPSRLARPPHSGRLRLSSPSSAASRDRALARRREPSGAPARRQAAARRRRARRRGKWPRPIRPQALRAGLGASRNSEEMANCWDVLTQFPERGTRRPRRSFPVRRRRADSLVPAARRRARLAGCCCVTWSAGPLWR